tara:strand:+ start:702 stop:1547 length:846 start_codon:yes stop_codon:yes gene_type:complete
MNNIAFNKSIIRLEISFKSYEELRSILSFYDDNNISKINIPCKNSLRNDFLLNSIKIAREEFPNIDVIPHFSILHEFRRSSLKTRNYLNEFLQFVKYLGCNQILLVSGSQKRTTLDTVSALCSIKDNSLFSNSDFSIGVAFNPYLPGEMFDEEIIRLEKKLKSGLVTSIWIQFGTDIRLLEIRLDILRKLILSNFKTNSKVVNISLFGSILIPSKQFLARFKYRPWKGVYCSQKFLDSVDLANKIVKELFEIYMFNNISPIIETNIVTEEELKSLNMLIEL